MRVLEVLSPTPVQFGPLLVCQVERAFTLRIRKALPKRHGVICPILCRELEEFTRWARAHVLIVSRVNAGAQRPNTAHRFPLVSEQRAGNAVWSRVRRLFGDPQATSNRPYSISVSVPVATSAADQIRSRLSHARRRMPTPSFSNTSTAINAVTAR